MAPKSSGGTSAGPSIKARVDTLFHEIQRRQREYDVLERRATAAEASARDLRDRADRATADAVRLRALADSGRDQLQEDLSGVTKLTVNITGFPRGSFIPPPPALPGACAARPAAPGKPAVATGRAVVPATTARVTKSRAAATTATPARQARSAATASRTASAAATTSHLAHEGPSTVVMPHGVSRPLNPDGTPMLRDRMSRKMKQEIAVPVDRDLLSRVHRQVGEAPIHVITEAYNQQAPIPQTGRALRFILVPLVGGKPSPDAMAVAVPNPDPSGRRPTLYRPR